MTAAVLIALALALWAMLGLWCVEELEELDELDDFADDWTGSRHEGPL